MPASGYAPSSGPSSLVQRQPKRRGVALSCAECRRLKLKCSRAFPCSNCVKKGCAAICPEGSLTTGKGNRFVLANTEALHEKITALASRVRQLEDGLAASHSLTSSEPHPLLADELLQIKRPLERERLDVPPSKEKEEPVDPIDSLGSLSISQDGKSTFFGQAANSWYLLQNEGASSDDDEHPATVPYTSQSPMPHDISWTSHAFPFALSVNESAETVRSNVMGGLPSRLVATTLCEIYYRHAAWMYSPIAKQDFLDNIFRHVYDSAASCSVSSPMSTASSVETLAAPNLAILFMVFALGALLDLDKPAHNAEAMQYYHLARAAISIDCVLEEHSIPAIQALLLMCHFMFLAEMSAPRWVLMGVIVKLAQSVGLHRDGGKWKLDAEKTQRRRELFYELLTYDSWQSLTYGRPPSLSSVHIDNQFPHEPTKSEDGEMEMSSPALNGVLWNKESPPLCGADDFAAWKHRFSAQCLSTVIDQAFGARTPSYKVVQELDRKVRTWYVPPSLQVPGFGTMKSGSEVERPSVELTMQRYTAFAIREMTLFYMHRGFFAKAMEDCPNDPMGSKYSPSVLSAHTSATTFVGLVESLFNQHPALTERMWFLFTHVFSCAIVLGAIASKSHMALARSALLHLETAYNLFSKVSDHARAGKILPILQKLRDKARLAKSVSGGPIPASEGPVRSGLLAGPKIKTEVDEMGALGGMTRLVARPLSASPSTTSSPPIRNAGTPPRGSSSLSVDSQQQQQQQQPQQPQMYLSPPETPVWGTYTHIQNFNVNINVGDYSSFTATLLTPIHQTNDLYPYSAHQQQQHQQHQHQHQHPHQYQHQPQHSHHPSAQPSTSSAASSGLLSSSVSGPSSAMLVDPSAQDLYYGYDSPGAMGGSGYGGGFMMNPLMGPGNEGMGGTTNDLHESWQNFMSRFGP